jgi:hypothetical protein
MAASCTDISYSELEVEQPQHANSWVGKASPWGLQAMRIFLEACGMYQRYELCFLSHLRQQ